MNHGRRLYLCLYNAIDVLDHLLKNARIFYRTWKYWHAPVNHALAIVVCVAYDIYLEVCEGQLFPAMKVEKPMGRWEFRERLSLQIFKYNSIEMKYPGDEKMRAVTVLPVNKRKSSVRDERIRAHVKENTRGLSSKGCGDLGKLCRHVKSIKSSPNGRSCAWCGQRCYQVCMMCRDKTRKDSPLGVPLHYNEANKTVSMCFYNYHNDNCIGLARKEGHEWVNGKRKISEWTEPTKAEIDQNGKIVKSLKTNRRN